MYSSAADGSGLRQLTDTLELESDLSVAPDGESIAFYRHRLGDTEPVRLVVLSLATGQERDLGPAHIVRGDYLKPPAWSPDGRSLAWANGFQCDTLSPTSCYQYEVVTVDVETRSRRRIARRAVDPAWSPDGRKIAYVRVVWVDDPKEYGERNVISQETLIVADRDGRNPRIVARGVEAPSWSSEGRLAFAARGQVTVSSADGTGKRRAGRGFPPLTWSPDGGSVAANLYFYNTPSRGFWMIRLDGSGSRFVRSAGTRPGSVIAPWSPYGRQMVWGSGSALAVANGDASQVRRIEVAGGELIVYTAHWGRHEHGWRVVFTAAPRASAEAWWPCFRGCE